MIGRVSGFIACGLLVLGIAVGSSIIVAAQDSTLPKDPAVAYIEKVMLPVLRGQTSVYGDEFYDQWLSRRSRAQITEFQFVSYLQTEADKVAEKTRMMAIILHYQISNVIAQGDEGRVEGSITGSLTSFDGSRQITIPVNLSVIREDGAWKLLLPQDMVSKMQSLPRGPSPVQSSGPWTLYVIGGGRPIGWIAVHASPSGSDKYHSFASEAECEAFKTRLREALSAAEWYISTDNEGSMYVRANTSFECHK